MNEHTFANWLHSEVVSARCALLTLYEQMEKLQYIDGPLLEQTYMDKVGTFEQEVIKAEIECELLQKKQQMIQAALNRRELVDEAAIDAEIDKLRQEMFNEASGTASPQECAILTDEQSEELQRLYRSIVRNFHPQMHPELTDAHKELFKKAQEAYRHKDLDALRLIHEMLMSTIDDGISLELLLDLLAAAKDEKHEAPKEEAEKPHASTDYKLAALIYDSFRPTAEEAAIREDWIRYRQSIESTMREMEALRQQFPYNAAEMLSNPNKVEDYKNDLEQRLCHANTECERRRQTIINMMMEGVAAHG